MQPFERALPVRLEPAQELRVLRGSLALVHHLALARLPQAQPRLVLLALDQFELFRIDRHSYIVRDGAPEVNAKVL